MPFIISIPGSIGVPRWYGTGAMRGPVVSSGATGGVGRVEPIDEGSWRRGIRARFEATASEIARRRSPEVEGLISLPSEKLTRVGVRDVDES